MLPKKLFLVIFSNCQANNIEQSVYTFKLLGGIAIMNNICHSYIVVKVLNEFWL